MEFCWPARQPIEEWLYPGWKLNTSLSVGVVKSRPAQDNSTWPARWSGWEVPSYCFFIDLDRKTGVVVWPAINSSISIWALGFDLAMSSSSKLSLAMVVDGLKSSFYSLLDQPTKREKESNRAWLLAAGDSCLMERVTRIIDAGQQDGTLYFLQDIPTDLAGSRLASKSGIHRLAGS